VCRLAPNLRRPVRYRLTSLSCWAADREHLALPRIERPPDDPWWTGKLDEACGRGEPICLRLLLERCDVSQCAPTILHLIAGEPWPSSQGFRPEEERVMKARLLLEAGARLDVRDAWNKSTPLGLACAAGRADPRTH
jgi:hypothetical protein